MRFRRMEQSGPFTGLSLEEMEARWEKAKRLEMQDDKELPW